MYNGQISKEEIYIVDTSSSPIKGLQTSKTLNVIKLVLATYTSTLLRKQVLSKYSGVITGNGKLPGEFQIHWHKNVTLVEHPPRKIHVAIRNKLKIELDQMTSLGIIKKVTTPTD